MNWYLHGCPVCGGDLHDDLENHTWLECFLCARSFRLADLLARRTHGQFELVANREASDAIPYREAREPVAA